MTTILRDENNKPCIPDSVNFPDQKNWKPFPYDHMWYFSKSAWSPTEHLRSSFQLRNIHDKIDVEAHHSVSTAALMNRLLLKNIRDTRNSRQRRSWIHHIFIKWNDSRFLSVLLKTSLQNCSSGSQIVGQYPCKCCELCYSIPRG